MRKGLFLLWARPRLLPLNRNGRSHLQPYQIHALQPQILRSCQRVPEGKNTVYCIARIAGNSLVGNHPQKVSSVRRDLFITQAIYLVGQVASDAKMTPPPSVRKFPVLCIVLAGVTAMKRPGTSEYCNAVQCSDSDRVVSDERPGKRTVYCSMPVTRCPYVHRNFSGNFSHNTQEPWGIQLLEML